MLDTLAAPCSTSVNTPNTRSAGASTTVATVTFVIRVSLSLVASMAGRAVYRELLLTESHLGLPPRWRRRYRPSTGAPLLRGDWVRCCQSSVCQVSHM